MAIKKPKITKTKNVSVLPAKDDFSELDSAVSELAKETEALLGKTGERMSKPILPKRSTNKTKSSTSGKESAELSLNTGVKSSSKAKSFDIIHPTKATKTESILKAPHPGQKLIEANESEGSAPNEPETDTESTTIRFTSDATVSTHKPGSLKFTEAKNIQPIKDQDVDSDETSSKQEDKLDEPNQLEVKESSLSDETNDKFEEDSESDNLDSHKKTEDVLDKDTKDATVENPKPNDDIESKPDTNTEDKSEEDESQKNENKEDTALTDPTKKVQLYSDNLTKGEDEEDSEDDNYAPAILDTDEYHPTLHDWSKLEHHSRGPIFVLLLLSVILAAGLYIVLTGIKIPFL